MGRNSPHFQKIGTSLPRIADAKQFIKIKMSKDESNICVR